jgi:hypothetical protein
MHSTFHSYHQMWAITPSRRTGIVRHGWGLGNSAFTVYGLAACPLAPGARASTGFSLHATVPSYLSIEGKKLLYSRCLSEVAIARRGRLWASLGALRRTI